MPGKRNRHRADRQSAAAADRRPVSALLIGSKGPASTRFWLPLSMGVLLISAGLLFYGLGHYPLWCDEADTALFGEAIARTGDLNAVIDHNLIANRQGACLKSLRGRYQPPLPYYIVAPFVGAAGNGSFWPRFPFAVCGLLSVAVMLYWMSRSELTAVSWIVYSLGLLGNVSFFLYCRQCRYYALAILLSLLIAYWYLQWDGKRWRLAALVVASILLLATQYLAYAGLYVALACDYLVFARRRQQFTLVQLLWLLVPQLIIGGIIVSIYNPLGTGAVPQPQGHNLLLDKLTLWWWNLRDLNVCEYGVGLLMLAAPLWYLFDKNIWLLRAPLAVLVYAAAIAVCSPQPVDITLAADIRYLSALIPLCIFLTGLSILTLARYRWLIAIPLALLAFETNILNRPLKPPMWRSTICQWIEELADARTTAGQQAIDWVKNHVQPGQSVWAMPIDFMAYPLMYHAPQAIYAWQLRWPPEEQFKDLPAINFVGRFPPDYIISFGPQLDVKRALEEYKRQLQIDYILSDTLNIYWDDRIRPELFLHGFKPVLDFNPGADAVYVFRRSGSNEAH